jgi:cyclase
MHSGIRSSGRTGAMRARSRVFTAAAALALAIGPFAPSARAAEPPPLRTETVAPGVWMLSGNGGNIAVSAGTDGIFIIDDQFAPSVPGILEAIAKLQNGPIRFVINTHWHGDHTGGNESLGSAGAVIVAHENVRRRMSVPQFMRSMNRETPASPRTALPVVTFTDAVTLHLNDDDIRIVHVAPAHTDGDAIVRFEKANVIHAGDTYFAGMYPFFDVSSGGNLRGMIAACDAILALADEKTRIIPGHGPLSDAAGVRAYRAMLQGVLDRVAPLVAAGKSLEEVMAARPTAAYDATWGQGFFTAERWLPLVYGDLVAERSRR